jgi:hypothetical protein
MTEHIDIPSVLPRIQFIGDGQTTVFIYPFPIFEAADLWVYLDAVRQTNGFTVSDAGETAGGECIFDAAPAQDVIVTLVRKTAIYRTTDFSDSLDFRKETFDLELDIRAAVDQEIDARLARAIRLADTDTDTTMELPAAADRANLFLGFDSDGSVIVGPGGGGGSGGVTAHGDLTGLDADDHTQYLNITRVNAWLGTKSTDDLGEGAVNKYMHLAGAGAATTAARSDHDHNDATTGTAGFMSAADKTKLDGIEAGAVAEGATGDAFAAANAPHEDTVAPTANDDSSQGYFVGKRWINTATGNEYVCVDATVGAAVWQITTTAGAGDYATSQITNDSAVDGDSAADALNTLNTTKGARIDGVFDRPQGTKLRQSHSGTTKTIDPATQAHNIVLTLQADITSLSISPPAVPLNNDNEVALAVALVQDGTGGWTVQAYDSNTIEEPVVPPYIPQGANQAVVLHFDWDGSLGTSGKWRLHGDPNFAGYPAGTTAVGGTLLAQRGTALERVDVRAIGVYQTDAEIKDAIEAAGGTIARQVNALGSKTTGTVYFDVTAGDIVTITNDGGPWTLDLDNAGTNWAAGTVQQTIVVWITAGASAGAVTFAGQSKVKDGSVPAPSTTQGESSVYAVTNTAGIGISVAHIGDYS